MYDYDSLTELMKYFHFEFFVHCMLVLIVFTNCINAVLSFLDIKNNKPNAVYPSFINLITSAFSIIGLFSAVYFQGVLSDVSSTHSEIWTNKIFLLCIIAIVLFIVQIIFCKKSVNFKSK